ncbi:MAG: imidazole glycerol phosphate synthase subunit HisH [Tissierellia bacterium]|nr:imidazole glycerol phosphate synthase subunit HisH [Tissierellia bacterium]
MHIIIDYGVGNIGSVCAAFQRVGMDIKLSSDREEIRNAKSLILPGVGAFGDAIDKMKKKHFIEDVYHAIDQGAWLLGICLGMQLLYEKSEEHGNHIGMGLLEGEIKHLEIPLRIPHLGWNQLDIKDQNHPLLKFVKNGEYVYYIHSYYAETPGKEILATSHYGIEVPGIVHKDRVFGMQFHPEKSGDVGHRLLMGYKEMVEE